jgi:hypothetical protein
MASVSNKRWQIPAGWKTVADASQGVLLDSSAIIALLGKAEMGKAES